METDPLSKFLLGLRKSFLRQEGAGWTDGQLLEGYLTRRDEAAFEALVRRHGPMVLEVCRRVLRDEHEAQDAFQATFLVLVRKAASIRPRELVANWLYGVACNVARKARAVTARRRARERQVVAMPEPATEPQDPGDDLQRVLDQELSRLSEKYRVPLILCELEGKTHKQAARQLGVPEGTVSGRLSRARALLAKRLTRRGVVLPAGALAAAIAQAGASGCVPPALVTCTVRAAGLFGAGQAAATGVLSTKVAALAEGVLKSMLLTKLHTAFALVLGMGLVCGGAAALSYHTSAAEPANPKQVGMGQAPFRGAAKSKPDETVLSGPLDGTWAFVSIEYPFPDPSPDLSRTVEKASRIYMKLDDSRPRAEGWKFTGEKVQHLTCEVKGGKWIDHARGRVVSEATITLDASKRPSRIDLAYTRGPVRGNTVKGIYQLNGDVLTLCFGDDRNYPVEFAAKKNAKLITGQLPTLIPRSTTMEVAARPNAPPTNLCILRQVKP
jgi:RNA polymerase sigma-70 factor (ECF subfamily)